MKVGYCKICGIPVDPMNGTEDELYIDSVGEYYCKIHFEIGLCRLFGLMGFPTGIVGSN